MYRIILSIVVVIGIVGWVIFFQLQQKKDPQYCKTDAIDQKSYVSISLLSQGLDTLTIKHEKLVELKLAIHEQIVGMDGFINAIIVTLLA